MNPGAPTGRTFRRSAISEELCSLVFAPAIRRSYSGIIIVRRADTPPRAFSCKNVPLIVGDNRWSVFCCRERAFALDTNILS